MVTLNFLYLVLALSLVRVQIAFAQDDLEQRVTDLETEVVQINDEVDEVEGVANQNTGQIFEVINDVDDIDELNVAQEQRIGTLEEENSLLRFRLDLLEQMFNSLNETVSDLDIGSDNSTNERLDALESDITTLEGGFTQLESDVTTLEGDVTTLEGGFTQLESDVTTLEGDITTLEGGFTQLQSDVTTLESDVTTLVDDVTTLGNSITDLDQSTDQRLDTLEENIVDYSHTAFLASHSASTFVPSKPIVWDTAILNPGGHYNPESGIYTVPVDGIYQFVLQYRNYDDVDTAAWLVVDNVRIAYTSEYEPDHGYNSHNLVMTLSLTSGQLVWIQPNIMSGLYGTSEGGMIYSWFSGHLIYPL